MFFQWVLLAPTPGDNKGRLDNKYFTLKLPALAFLHCPTPSPPEKSFRRKSLSRDPWPHPSVHHSSAGVTWWISILFLNPMPRLRRGNSSLLTESSSGCSFVCVWRSQTVGRLERTRRCQKPVNVYKNKKLIEKLGERERERFVRAECLEGSGAQSSY